MATLSAIVTMPAEIEANVPRVAPCKPKRLLVIPATLRSTANSASFRAEPNLRNDPSSASNPSLTKNSSMMFIGPPLAAMPDPAPESSNRPIKQNAFAILDCADMHAPLLRGSSGRRKPVFLRLHLDSSKELCSSTASLSAKPLESLTGLHCALTRPAPRPASSRLLLSGRRLLQPPTALLQLLSLNHPQQAVQN